MTRDGIEPREAALGRMIARADRLLDGAARLSSRYTRWRLAIVAAGAVLSVTAYRLQWFHAGNAVVAVFIAGFLIVARYHSRLEQAMHRMRLWRGLKRASLARVTLDWPNIPERAVADAPPRHPYAADLDLTGRHSLLTLLDTTLSTAGRDRLRSWLLDQHSAPPDAAAWEARRALIRELTPLALFRDRLALEATLLDRAELDGLRLQAALSQPMGFRLLTPLLIAETILAAVTAGSLLWAAVTGTAGYWPLTFVLYVVLYLFASVSLSPVFGGALSLHGELQKLAGILRYLERRSYAGTPAVARAVAPLVSGGDRPFVHVASIARLTAALSVRANPIAHVLLNAAMPWDLYYTYRLERRRAQIGDRFEHWFSILADVEAASALAAFAWRHPRYPWPTRVGGHRAVANGDAATLHAEGLAHPLLPAGHRVANDVTLNGIGQVLLITGSNMSGKSTFLRTIGINLCLAQAGAPVCASVFEYTWLRPYCCIRVDDSLEDGLSFFYAEVQRLKALLDAAADRSAPPVLFLIDEIFKGTNNRERLIGSRAYIRALARTHAFGLITTHDLELTELDREIPQLTNAHFQETVAESALKFDYRLRPGPCPTTNALRIMALQGLPVSPHAESPTRPTSPAD